MDARVRRRCLVRGAVVGAALAAGALGGTATCQTSNDRDSCEKAQLTIPAGTRDRSQATAFVGSRPQKVAWTPGYCVMTVQLYQNNQLVEEWKNQKTDAFLTPRSAHAGETEIKIWKDGKNEPADARWLWLPEPIPAAQDLCAKRPQHQTYEGVCLPDRLVEYLVCVGKMGGNRLKVTKEEASKNNSVVTFRAKGNGEGLVVQGAGEAEFTQQNVDESIRKLDETFGSDATKICLQLVPPRPLPSPRSSCPTSATLTATRVAGGHFADVAIKASPKIRGLRYRVKVTAPNGKPYLESERAEPKSRVRLGDAATSGLFSLSAEVQAPGGCAKIVSDNSVEIEVGP